MAIYRIQRIYSDEDNQNRGGSGWGTFGKIAAGTALAAGTFAAGKAGMLGGAMQRGTNSVWANVGKSIGSQSMVNSGAKGLAEGQYKRAISTLEGRAAAGNVKAKTRLDFLKGDAGKEQFINRKTAAAQNKFKIETPAPAASTTATTTTTTAATQAAFSEDTNATLRGAAYLGAGLLLTGGGVLAAKHGLLGEAAQKGYEKASGKLKKIWNEKKTVDNLRKGAGRGVKDSVLGGTTGTTTGSVTESAAKIIRKKYPKKDKGTIIEFCKKNKMNFRDPEVFEKAAESLGIKPIS